MPLVHVTWDDAAVRMDVQAPGGKIASTMARLAASLTHSMKFRCPVYTGPQRVARGGRGPGRKSGTLRSSVQAFRQPDGSYLIGPTDTTASGRLLGPMIEAGTPPHVIRSHGPWPLRNRATGDVFGPVVHHPGTAPHPFIRLAAYDLQGVRMKIR